jgi:serine/threonine protein phosphatase PrpC
MQIYKRTDVGLRRTSNQDFCDGGIFPDGAAWAVVCDGMGGANGGNIASALAVEKICEVFRSQYEENKQDKEIEKLLFQAAEEANSVVFQVSQEDEALKGMGTTLVAAIIKEGYAHIIHIGDSRAYVISDTYAEQVTIDHSMVQELLLLGEITMDEAKNHPQRNIITRALGIHENVNGEYDRVPFQEKNKLLLCTDGMSNYMDEEDIYKISKGITGEELADRLVRAALEAGGSDNITVVIIDSEKA